MSYNLQNDREITGSIPLYTVIGDLDAVQNTQIGPTISPQTDISTFLGDGAKYGVKPGSILLALLMAAAVVAGAAVLLKTKTFSF
jgi:hypothetical protein